MSRAHGLVAIPLTFLLAACVPPGQRLLTVRVEQAGEAVLTGSFAIGDHLAAPDAWRRLADVDLTPAGSFAGASTSLRGEVDIVLEHAGRPFASARGVRLAATRTPGGWRIATGDVERATRGR